MNWVIFANIHRVGWKVEDHAGLHAKVYRFKKGGNQLDYFIPYSIIESISDKLIDLELLRVIRGLV